MKNLIKIFCATAILVHFYATNLYPRSGPFDGKNFKGRIAYSADGNYNDEDDWAASPVALAIFAECGVKNKLVHFDYNCILHETDARWEKEHTTSVLGAATKYGYSKSVFYDCRKDLNAAIESIKNSINESSADNPLYFILAGPMEVPYLGIQKSDPGKRQFVYCISHSRWNDGYANEDFVHHNKRHVIPLGITWVQITDQNKFLTTSPYGRPAKSDEWRPWYWMRDSNDPKVRFLWDRMRTTARADCSDAGMAYFLMTGDEESEITKLIKLLDGNTIPTPIGARKNVRIEAENFRTLDNYEVEQRNDRSASHRLSTRLVSVTTGRIRTPFNQFYTADSGRYNVDIRYFDEEDGRSEFRFYVNGIRKGDTWNASGDDKSWKTRTISDVIINTGDEIIVEVRGDSGEYGKLDYVQLNYISSNANAADSPIAANY